MFMVGTLGASLTSRIHSGGYLNVLMPAHAGLAIVFGLGTAALLARSEASGRNTLTVAVFGACLLQFAMLGYDPRRP